MCKANTAIESKVNELLSLIAMQEDLNAEIEALKDEIKAFMESESAETMTSGDHVVTYKEVVTKRIDTTALKKLLGDALEPYFNKVVTKRFQIR